MPSPFFHGSSTHFCTSEEVRGIQPLDEPNNLKRDRQTNQGEYGRIVLRKSWKVHLSVQKVDNFPTNEYANWRNPGSLTRVWFWWFYSMRASMNCSSVSQNVAFRSFCMNTRHHPRQLYTSDWYSRNLLCMVLGKAQCEREDLDGEQLWMESSHDGRVPSCSFA